MYVSTKNMSLPKGHARKLAPKFIGPDRLRQQGIHSMFHSSLLRIHVPNNDRLFPGRQETQVADFGESEPEWQVEHVLSHVGSGPGATFELRWTSGDVTWMSYDRITHLTALTEYLDLLDVKRIDNLPRGTGGPPSDDPQIYNAACHLQLHDSLTPYPTMCDRQKKPPRRNQRGNFQNIEARGENFVFVDTQVWPRPSFTNGNQPRQPNAFGIQSRGGGVQRGGR